MPEAQAFPLRTKSGRRGQVFRRARFLDRGGLNRVQLDDGTELNVPSASLSVEPDGSFLLDDAALRPASVEPAPEARETTSAPIHEAPPVSRPPEIERPQRAAPPQARVQEQVVQQMAPKWQAEEAVMMSDPLFTEDVQVERVTVNRMLDAPVETRQEGDTTIIPVIEEVVTVQKRLMLREEVRITRRRVEVREPRKLVLHGPEPRIFGADGREIEPVS